MTQKERDMTRIHAGDSFPEFVFQTAYEEDLFSRDILKGKTVFWFLRYIGCTICRYDVHLLSLRYEEFVRKGAQVYVVLQSDREHLQRDLKDAEPRPPFSIISDPEAKIYQLLDIRPAASMEELKAGAESKLKEKVAKANETGFFHGDYEGNEQQLQALFIVGEDNTVEYAHYAGNIMDMPSIDGVLELL